jgi:hypothetical protein
MDVGEAWIQTCMCREETTARCGERDGTLRGGGVRAALNSLFVCNAMQWWNGGRVCKCITLCIAYSKISDVTFDRGTS